tara:strand:+ start:29018 stop:30526 length:1509 start_codon:yes stop_codon:yes gene_type:complete
MSTKADQSKTAAIMIQGTGSDVGKSFLVAALARAFVNRGLRVSPFKPQNMSNNAAVCAGGEIGRAQALQAKAARIDPSVNMNPILLKPQNDIGAQVIIKGKLAYTASAHDYHLIKKHLLNEVINSFQIMSNDSDLVLVEGAGSPSEINLRKNDIANMGFANAAKVPVLIVGDIERGGVIASLIGTCMTLPENDRLKVKGLIVNKFRGDISLFDNAHSILHESTGVPVIGVVPWCKNASILPKEDSSSLIPEPTQIKKTKNNMIKIAVLRLPRIANFDDLDPLIAEGPISLNFIESGKAIPGNCDLIIIPGSKATRADLKSIKEEGWHIDIVAHVRRGGKVLGLCGGYQILGNIINDKLGIEGSPGVENGLGLLNVNTTIEEDKTITETNAIHVETETEISGYEIHMGQTSGPDTARPWARHIDGKSDGAISKNGKVAGTYIHGAFANDTFRHAWIKSFARNKTIASTIVNWDESIESTLDEVANTLEESLNLDLILEIARGR